jgi:hypothetical protein
MPPTDAPNHLDIASQLAAGTYYYLIYMLRQTFPSRPQTARKTLPVGTRPPSPGLPHSARPTPPRPTLAAAYVAAAEQWKECLRLAQQPEMSLLGAIKCRPRPTA